MPDPGEDTHVGLNESMLVVVRVQDLMELSYLIFCWAVPQLHQKTSSFFHVVFRGLDPEEPVQSTARLCCFKDLEVTVRLPFSPMLPTPWAPPQQNSVAA